MPLSLVTGGCGFIGRHLAMELQHRGGCVRVLDPSPGRGLPERVVHHRGSIFDADALAEAMEGVDTVFHLAGSSAFWMACPGDLHAINAGGTERVLKAAAAAGVGRVVHCSTEVVLLSMRRERGCVSEDALPPADAMAGPYTRSKHAAETAALAAAGEGLDVVIASPTVPVGARDYNLTPPAAMLDRFLQGKAPVFLDCMLNLVGVRDLARGLALAGEHGVRGERYVLGGENLRLRELLERMERLSGRRMPKLSLPAPAALAIGTIAEWVADHLTRRPPAATREGVRLALHSGAFDGRLARERLGYDPAPIDPALAEAVNWLMARVQSERAPAPDRVRERSTTAL